MKFQLQDGESLLNKSVVAYRSNAKSVSDLSYNNQENGRLYITSERVVFTSTRGILALVGQIVDLLFPSLQDEVIDVPYAEIRAYTIRKITGIKHLVLKMNDDNGQLRDFVFAGANVLANSSWVDTVSQVILSAAKSKGVEIPFVQDA